MSGGYSYLSILAFPHNEVTAYLFFLKRYLSDLSHHETYESAHSVILSSFACHAQRQQHTGKTKATKHLSDVINAGGGRDNKHDSENGKVFSSISNPLGEEVEDDSVDLLTNFVERMVPFYAQCLIEVGPFFVCLPSSIISLSF